LYPEENTMPDKHIIVIGAGIAGLTCAYRLQQAGHHVQVFEAAKNPGGRMITIHWNGKRIDPGAEFVTGADKYLMEMVKELQLTHKLIHYSDEQTGFNVTVMRAGRLHTVNFMSILSYLRWTGVSLGARLSMLKLVPYLLRAGRADVFQPEAGPGDDALDMEAFFHQKISAEMFEYWVQPTMDVFCGYTPSDLSAKMLLMLFGSYLSQKLYTFEGGIGFFPDALASRIDITYQTQASRVELYQDGSGAKVFLAGRAQPVTADRIVLAIPGDAVLPLFEAPQPAWQAFFPGVRYTRVGIVYHLLEGDDPSLDEGGIMFPRREPWQLSALGWKRHPDGKVLAMSDLKAHLYDPAISDDELRQVITSEAVRAVPAFANRIIDQMVFRWDRKVPAFPPGYLTALKKFKESPQEKPLYFCGDYLIGPSTGSALASGWQCADRLLAAL
jgi:protoporphyrinogen/coproporphyrinogen III oxidase